MTTSYYNSNPYQRNTDHAMNRVIIKNVNNLTNLIGLRNTMLMQIGYLLITHI